jgi:hypothetical protein
MKFLKRQIGTSKTGSGGKQKLPLVFTENGIAMMSGILNSERAIYDFRDNGTSITCKRNT